MNIFFNRDFSQNELKWRQIQNNSLLVPQTPLTKSTAFWEQLSVFLSLRWRRRFRKLKRASRLKLFLVLAAELLLLLVVETLGALSRFPSAPSARSPAEQEKGQFWCAVTDNGKLMKLSLNIVVVLWWATTGDTNHEAAVQDSNSRRA